MISMPVDEMLCNYVPYLFDLEDINDRELFDEENNFIFPPSVSPCSESL